MLGDEEFHGIRSRIAQRLKLVGQHEEFDECKYSLKTPGQ
jgi:hypothetical protein